MARTKKPAVDRLVFLTGLSGSGKSAAINCFEDMGFFCSDNVPTVLIEDFVTVLRKRRESIPQVALVVDVRERDFFQHFIPIYQKLLSAEPKPEIVFLEASDEVLHRRFSETKRPHPLALNRSAEEGIREERVMLEEVRDQADMIIDTSNFTHYQLRDHIQNVFRMGNRLVVSVRSFGYKYGVPLDSDLVFDVRFLKNPYYEPDLRELTGEDEEVREYVFADPDASEFLESLKAFVLPLVPRYIHEGKAYLNISIGCTGGRHRSVCLARLLADALEHPDWAINLSHRDFRKG